MGSRCCREGHDGSQDKRWKQCKRLGVSTNRCTHETGRETSETMVRDAPELPGGCGVSTMETRQHHTNESGRETSEATPQDLPGLRGGCGEATKEARHHHTNESVRETSEAKTLDAPELDGGCGVSTKEPRQQYTHESERQTGEAIAQGARDLCGGTTPASENQKWVPEPAMQPMIQVCSANQFGRGASEATAQDAPELLGGTMPVLEDQEQVSAPAMQPIKPVCSNPFSTQRMDLDDSRAIRKLGMEAQSGPQGHFNRHKRWPTPGMQFGDATTMYEVGQYLADSTAIVYECHPASDPNKVYAVKIYDPKDNLEAYRDFEMDAACFGAIKACTYPKDGRNLLVQKFGQFESNTDGCHFLVMEKIRDENSEVDLLQEIAKEGGFDEDVAQDVFEQLVYAIGCVHGHDYVHRDLKADNILIESSYWKEDKKYYNIKLTDFGIARRVHPKLAIARTHLGTVNMKPPEIEDHKGLYNGKAVDMWGLGVILFTMVLGEAFPGPKIAARSGRLCIHASSNWFSKPLSDNLRDLIANLLRWEADPAGFCPRMNMDECRKHPWLQAFDTPLSKMRTFSEIRRSSSHTWSSSRPVFFCQRLQVTEDECDGCFLQLASDYDFLGHGIRDSDFIKSRCLGAATICKRQVLSIVSMGVHVQRTQPKTILRIGDIVYYGVANTLSKVRPDEKAFHTEFEGRLCRSEGVGFGLMECVEFNVKAHMNNCVIGGPQHRGNNTSLGWIRFRNNYGGLTIAILQKADGKKCFYPLATEILHEGDTLLIPRRFTEDDYSSPPDCPNLRKREGQNEKEMEDDENFEENISKHALNFESQHHFDYTVEKGEARGSTDES